MNNDSTKVVDYYQELSLDKDDSLSRIQKNIAKLKRENTKRAESLVGEAQKYPVKVLALVSEAEKVFASEESRESYDRSLLRSPAEVKKIDWIIRAWNYYFLEDFGAANVAARKARNEQSESPNAYVVSAWVEIALENWERAREYADEAYVLDENEESAVDVYLVRGVTFHKFGKCDKALASYNRAFAKSSKPQIPEIMFRRAACYITLEQYKHAIDDCIEGIKTDTYISPDIIRNIQHDCFIALEKYCYSADNPEMSKQAFQNMLDKFENLNVTAEAKEDILEFIRRQIRRCELLQVPEPNSSDNTEFPTGGIVVGVLALALLFWIPSIVTFLIAAVPCAWVVWCFARRANYKRLKNEYIKAREELTRFYNYRESLNLDILMF